MQRKYAKKKTEFWSVYKRGFWLLTIVQIDQLLFIVEKDVAGFIHPQIMTTMGTAGEPRRKYFEYRITSQK